MCDHCSKVTGQKGYGGQVTCKCEQGDKRPEDREKERDKQDFGGCCSKKAKEAAGGCCQSGCCKDGKEKKDLEKKDNGKSRGNGNNVSAASPK